ncbi:UDP-N-acetylmuramoyl-L-alanine--D-glutamate ligase [Sphingomonas abietis]|uniref:UDP-N-acetylmuramoylalanine--D-glutamate ligase n=1 Tax=Sphingomonas abietis TaxID=3012344 RepID=A0ABY7NPB9_9SPHN|nr:UDP-N-acetylmuramoyl-L-alanine--D-glutamate ligase [Sphingomonas abietis]WBO23389.1 UDP-N-acetylmuramoyl-L-alanine--D-glutamate ligase [Sphingomonas abietis]
MITSAAFVGKRYAVLGLARSGLATVRALVASGAQVTAWDSDEAKRNALPLPSGERVGVRGSEPQASVPAIGADHPHPTLSPKGEGFSWGDPMLIDLTGFDGIVVSPGVPLNTHPIASRGREAGVPIIGDIELFAQARASLPDHKVVAITGTNGKSTVTALIHHILQTAGVPTTLGGNIGLPILGQEPLPAGGVYVLELSSFQIDLTHSLAADVSVLTNITPDHLDRYDGFTGYAASKARLFAMQRPGQSAVIATDDEPTRALAVHLSRAVLPPLAMDGLLGAPLGMPPIPAGPTVVAVSAGDVTDQSAWPALQGPHNAQNVAIARAACRLLGIDDAAIEQGLRTYPGLPHRMERIAELAGVLYVNDSKATNATSTAPALGAYPKIHWILGGKRKTDDLDACKPYYGHVVAAYTIGEAAELFERILLESGIYARNLGTLDAAVKAAAQVARPGETVLLSPACASYDQFRDYEARGDAFRAAVAMLGTGA